MAASRRRIGPSRLILVVLLAALAIGVAASVLVAARTAGPPPPVGPTQTIVFPNWVIAAPILGFAAVIIGLVAYDRWENGGAGIPGRYIAFVLTILLLMIVFVEVVHLVAPGAFAPTDGAAPTNSTTQQQSNQSGTNLTGNGTTLLAPMPHPPPWVPFVAVVVIGIVVVVVLGPSLFQYLQDRRQERWGQRSTVEAKRALEDALGRAERDLAGGKDPRAAIMALYARLLAEVRPMASDVDHETPEEIRSLHLVRLGVRADAADALTRVFEEARYSTHPIGSTEVSRASIAIRSALDDLRRTVTKR